MSSIESQLKKAYIKIYEYLGLEKSPKDTFRFTIPKTTVFSRDIPSTIPYAHGVYLFETHAEEYLELKSLRNKLPDISLNSKVIKEIASDMIREAKEEKVQESITAFTSSFGDVTIGMDGYKCKWSDLRFLVPLNSATKGSLNNDLVYNTEARDLVPSSLIKSGGFANAINLKSASKKEYDEIEKVMSLLVVTIYDPTLPFGAQQIIKKIDLKDKEARKKQLEEESEKVYTFNLAGRQEWKSYRPSGNIPHKFIEFITHLFPVKEERLEVFKWIYHAQRGRTNFAMLLTGAKSVGKGVFYDLLASIIAADESEAFVAQPSLINGAFKASLKGSRLCYLDEIDVTSQVKTFLKRYLNSTASLEAKGKEVEKNVPMWANFIISNNNIESNNIDHDERRFFIPQITTTPLLDLWEDREKAVGEFKESFKDPQFISDVMDLITKSIIKGGGDLVQAPSDPLKTAFFYTLVESSLFSWKQTILSYPTKPQAQLDDMNAVDFTSLAKAVTQATKKSKEKEVLRLTSVRTFLDSYRHGPERLKVGYAEGKTQDTAKIYYTDEYLESIGRDKTESLI